MKKTTSCFVAALLSSAAFANTATYYVAMDGDDGGSRFGGRNLDIGCYERVKYGFIITVQ